MDLKEFAKDHKIILDWELCAHTTSTISKPENMALSAAETFNQVISNATAYHNYNQKTEQILRDRYVVLKNKKDNKTIFCGTPEAADKFIRGYCNRSLNSLITKIKNNSAEYIFDAPMANRISHYCKDNDDIYNLLNNAFLNGLNAKHNELAVLHDLDDICVNFNSMRSDLKLNSKQQYNLLVQLTDLYKNVLIS